MPKPLREPPPSSSVARLLDVEAASRALAPPQPTAPEPPSERQLASTPPATEAVKSNVVTAPFPLPAPTGEPANIKREFVLSPSTDETFTRLVDLYKRATGTRLSSSHVARAMLRGIGQCMRPLEREAEQIGRLKLPSNARGREGEREQFEEAIAEAFIDGIRSAAAYRREGR